MGIAQFLDKISALSTSESSGSFHILSSTILGLSVLELAAICVNLTLVLLFLFVVSVRKILVYKRIGIVKDSTTSNDSPICSVIDRETSDVSIGVWFKLSVLSCFYVLFVEVLVLSFDVGAIIWGEVLHWSLISVPASQVLAWSVLSFSALNCKFKVLEKFPFLLRVWWFLSIVYFIC